MKPILLFHGRFFAVITAASAALALPNMGTAQVLIRFDVAQLATKNWVTVSATGLPAGAEDSVTRYFDGISLQNFFTNASRVTRSEWATIGFGLKSSGVLLDRFLTSNYSYDADTINNDLLFTTSNANLFNFSTGAAAFSGTSVMALQSTLDRQWFPAVGYVGNIYTGRRVSATDINGGNVLIGQYEVVNSAIPEPSSAALVLGLVGAAVAVGERRRIPQKTTSAGGPA